MQVDGDDDEDDPIERTVPVYLSQKVSGAKPELQDHLYLLQSVLRPEWHPYDQERLNNVRSRPNQSKLEMKYDALVQGDADLTLVSQTVPNLTNYAVMTWPDDGSDEIHMSPVHTVVQMKPTFRHLDDAKDEMKNREAALGATDAKGSGGDETSQLMMKRRQPERVLQARVKSFAYITKKANEEDWIDLNVHKTGSEGCADVRDGLLFADVKAKAIPDERCIDSVSYVQGLMQIVPQASSSAAGGAGGGLHAANDKPDTAISKLQGRAAAAAAAQAASVAAASGTAVFTGIAGTMAEKGGEGDILPPISKEQLRELRPEQRLLEFLQRTQVSTTDAVREAIGGAEAADEALLLVKLKEVGTVVNGLWVLKSAIWYRLSVHMQNVRQYALRQLSTGSCTTTVEHLVANCHVVDRAAKKMLTSIAVVTTYGNWKLKDGFLSAGGLPSPSPAYAAAHGGDSASADAAAGAAASSEAFALSFPEIASEQAAFWNSEDPRLKIALATPPPRPKAVGNRDMKRSSSAGGKKAGGKKAAAGGDGEGGGKDGGSGSGDKKEPAAKKEPLPTLPPAPETVLKASSSKEKIILRDVRRRLLEGVARRDTLTSLTDGGDVDSLAFLAKVLDPESGHVILLRVGAGADDVFCWRSRGDASDPFRGVLVNLYSEATQVKRGEIKEKMEEALGAKKWADLMAKATNFAKLMKEWATYKSSGALWELLPGT